MALLKRGIPLTFLIFAMMLMPLVLVDTPFNVWTSSGDTNKMAEPEDFSLIAANGEDWLTGWTYRKKHNISGSSGAGNNYTTKIKVWYDETITAFATNGVGQPTNEMSRPQGIFFNNVTYIAWQGGDSTPDVFVIAYNHTSEAWSDSTNVAPTGLTDNAHAAPVITVNSTGYIHLFWGYSTTAMNHYTSDNSEDISSFTAQTPLVAAPSYSAYPHAISHQDTMHVFYSITDNTGAVVNRRVYIINSTDGGVTWGTPQMILSNYTEGNGWGVYHTPVAYGYGDRIDMTWTYVEVDAGIPDSWRRHIYHAYYNTTDSDMYNASGFNLGETITRIEANTSCLIQNTGSNYEVAGYPQLTVDDNNYPWVVYTMGNKTTNANEHWGNFTSYSKHWNGTDWEGPYTISTTGHFANSHAIRFGTSTDTDVYTIKSVSLEADGEQDQDYGGDLTKYNWNGTDWNLEKVMLREASAGYDLNYPNIPYNASSELYLLFCESDPDIYTGDMRVYATGTITGYASETSIEGNGETDFSDLRFTDNDGSTLLPYWIVDSEVANYADIWIKVYDSLENEVTIYMYYGNPDASAGSDASDVMPFYDDGATMNFENDTAGSAVWTHYDSKLNLTEYSTSTDAAAVGIVDPNLDTQWIVKMDEHGGAAGGTDQWEYGWFDEDNLNELVNTVANVAPKRRFWIDRWSKEHATAANYVRVTYKDTGSTDHYWNAETGWTTSSSNRQYTSGIITVKMWTDGTNFIMDVLSNDNSIFIGAAGKPSIAIASVASFTSAKCVAMTDPFTDAYAFNYTQYYFLGRNCTTTEPAHGDWWTEEYQHFDYVDQESNVDGQADIGLHWSAGFTAQQSAPDGTYDTLLEMDAGGIGDDFEHWYTSYSSDVDSSPDIGTETNPKNAQDLGDSDYMNIQEANQGGGTSSEWIDVNAFDSTFTAWDNYIGSTPYIDAQDYSTNYIHERQGELIDVGWFDFPSTSLSGTLTVNVSIWGFSDDNDDGVIVFVDTTGGGGSNMGSLIFDQGSGSYKTLSLGSYSASEVNAMRIFLRTTDTTIDDVIVDHMRLGVSGTGPDNYELDFEYQWSNANYSEAYEKVCINVQTYQQTGSETLKLWEWSGSDWSLLGTFSQNGWNNFTPTYLTGSTYTIKVNDTDQSSDATQDSWNIDSIILHTWSTTTNYRLDLEEQWTNARYDQDVEKLCVKWGSFTNVELLNITVWNTTDSQWYFLYQVTSGDQNAWTNISVSTWLTASTFTIRFVDVDQTLDSAQSTWQKDSCLLWTYPIENQAPANDQAPVVDNPDDTDNLYAFYKTYYVEVNVSDSNGHNDIDYVDLTFASNDRVSTYCIIRFNHTSNAFTEESDPNGNVILNITDSEYFASGNDVDVTFWIVVNWTFPDNADMDMRQQVYDKSSLSDDDWYEVNYDVETRLELSAGPTLNDGVGTSNRGEFDDTITASGTVVYYQSSDNYPVADEIDIWVGASEYGSNVGPWQMTSYEDTGGTFSNSVYADDAVGLDTHTFKAVEEGAGYSGTDLFQSTESATYITDRLNITIEADNENPSNGQQVSFTLTVEYDYDDTTCTTYTIQIARNATAWFTFENANKTLFNDTNTNQVYLYNATDLNDGVSETTHGLGTSNVFLTNTVTVTWSGGAQQKFLYDQFIITDTDYTNYDLQRDYFDSFIVSDTDSESAGFARAFFEAVSIVDGPISALVIFLKLLFDSLAVAGAAIFSVGKKFDEVLGLNDTIALAASFTKNYSESITFNETVFAVKSIQTFLFESFTVGFSYSLQKDLMRTYFDSFVISSSYTLEKDMTRSYFENFTVSVIYTLEKDMTRNFFEEVAFNESVTPEKYIQKVLFESMTISATYALQKDLVRNYFDSFTVSGTYALQKDMVRSFSEGITFNESVTPEKYIQKVLFESVTVSVTYALQKDLIRTFSESVLFGVDYNTSANISRNYWEQIVFNETCTPEKNPEGSSQQKFLFESFTVAEIIRNASGFVNNMNETITISDMVTAQKAIQQFFFESFTAGVDYTLEKDMTRSYFEEIIFASDINTAADLIRGYSESITFNESGTPQKYVQQLIFETFTIGAGYALQKDIVTTFSESVLFGVDYNTIADLIREFFESITFAEIIDAQQNQNFLMLYEIVTVVYNIINTSVIEPMSEAEALLWQLFLRTDLWGFFGPMGLVIAGYILTKKEKFLGILWFLVECLFVYRYLELVEATPVYWWHILIIMFGGLFTCVYPMLDRN